MSVSTLRLASTQERIAFIQNKDGNVPSFEGCRVITDQAANSRVCFYEPMSATVRNMKIIVTRDSVAAGDDTDAPHERQFAFPDSTSIEQAIQKIVDAGYLAKVQGKASWSAVCGHPISVVSQSWNHARAVSCQPWVPTAHDFNNGSISLHFNYHAQVDPEIVLEVIKRLKLR